MKIGENQKEVLDFFTRWIEIEKIKKSLSKKEKEELKKAFKEKDKDKIFKLFLEKLTSPLLLKEEDKEPIILEGEEPIILEGEDKERINRKIENLFREDLSQQDPLWWAEKVLFFPLEEEIFKKSRRIGDLIWELSRRSRMPQEIKNGFLEYYHLKPDSQDSSPEEASKDLWKVPIYQEIEEIAREEGFSLFQGTDLEGIEIEKIDLEIVKRIEGEDFAFFWVSRKKEREAK